MPCLDLCLLVFTRTGSGKLSLALSSSEPGQESCLVPPCLEVDQPMSQAAKEPRSQGAMQASSQGAKEPRSQAAKELSSQGAKEPRRQAAMEPTKLRNPAPPGQRTAKKVAVSFLCRLLVGKWSGLESALESARHSSQVARFCARAPYPVNLSGKRCKHVFWKSKLKQQTLSVI